MRPAVNINQCLRNTTVNFNQIAIHLLEHHVSIFISLNYLLNYLPRLDAISKRPKTLIKTWKFPLS